MIPHYFWHISEAIKTVFIFHSAVLVSLREEVSPVIWPLIPKAGISAEFDILDHDLLLETLSSFSLGTLHHTLPWFFCCLPNLICCFFLVHQTQIIKQQRAQVLQCLWLSKLIPLDFNRSYSFKYHQYAKDVLICISSLELFSECVLHPLPPFHFHLEIY